STRIVLLFIAGSAITCTITKWWSLAGRCPRASRLPAHVTARCRGDSDQNRPLLPTYASPEGLGLHCLGADLGEQFAEPFGISLQRRCCGVQGLLTCVHKAVAPILKLRLVDAVLPAGLLDIEFSLQHLEHQRRLAFAVPGSRFDDRTPSG